MKLRLTKLALGASLLPAFLLTSYHGQFSQFLRMGLGTASAQGSSSGATSSSPIAVSPDDRFVWVANPDSNSVTEFLVQGDANQKAAEIHVGEQPQNLAITPNGLFVYVTNTGDGTVSVISTATRSVVGTVGVGTEPYGIALTPNGTLAYVANARSNDVSVINTASNSVLKTIPVEPEPRGVAITSDGDTSDDDEKVYITHFLSFDRPGVLVGRDDYKEGHLTVISTANGSVIDSVVLHDLKDTGFKSNGSALDRIPTRTPDEFFFTTGAFPNMFNNIAIKGNHAYLPNNAASPNGPLRFNVNIQAFLSVVDTVNDVEGTANGQVQTINMNRGIQFEAESPTKLFPGVPWHIAFKHQSNEGWVVSSLSNFAVKVVLDADGTPTINAPKAAGDPGNVVRVLTGQNPRGIAINNADTRAFVMNEVSRDMTIIDLTSSTALATVSSSGLPAAGTLEADIQIGKAIFNSGTGVNLPSLGPDGVIGLKLSNAGWSGCFGCHAFGLTDGVTWIFNTGPRRSLPMNGIFNPHDPTDQKILNYSDVNDEVADFENNIRDISGGAGLITGSVNAQLGDPNAGRSSALDKLETYIKFGVRTPISPLRNVSFFSREHDELALGRQLFAQAGCVDCHSGGGWSVARRFYSPPPPAAEIVRGQIFRLLRQVGTFDPAAVNEIRQNGAPPLGADGFHPPSLLGVFAMGPLLHNGSAVQLDDILDNLQHRRAGQSLFQVDPLNDADNRRALLTFLKSIDASTVPFPAVPGH
jgi:YVTN family beta-propeller protein